MGYSIFRQRPIMLIFVIVFVCKGVWICGVVFRVFVFCGFVRLWICGFVGLWVCLRARVLSVWFCVGVC